MKGSAFKEWYSQVDYVPIISDVDIHIKLVEGERITPLDPDSFDLAISYSESYETLFSSRAKDEQHKFIHIPRIQMVQLNLHGGRGYKVPPRPQDVKEIKGPIRFKPEMEPAKVRNMDLRNVLIEKDYIYSFPEKLFYRSGFELLSLLPTLTSKVSPFPIRLLNQILIDENPHDIWNWNRTKIISELRNHGLNQIADNYENYYKTGWKLFKTDFKDNDLLRLLISNGFNVLNEVYNESIMVIKRLQ